MPFTTNYFRREKKVRTRRVRRMMAKKVKTKREKRKKARERVTNKPSPCFNLDCTERGEFFSRLDNFQYGSYYLLRLIAFVKQTLLLCHTIICETFLISPMFVDNSIQLLASLQTA